MLNIRPILRFLALVVFVTLTLAWVPAALAATPMLISLSPSSATSGGSAFALTIYGQNLTPDSTAKWGSTVLTTTYRSATVLTAAIPASLIASAGQASVTVSTAGETSVAAVFTVESSLPAISSLSPASAVAGRALPSNTNNAALASTSTWGATPQTTAIQSVTQRSLPVSSSLIAASGGTSTQVALPANPSSPAATAPASTNQSAAQLTASAHANLINTLSGSAPGAALGATPPSPVISSLSPASATVGGAAFTLTINGANFTSPAISNWGSMALATAYISATQLTAVVPANLIATAGTASITVTTAGGTSAPVILTVAAQVPVITYYGPSSATAGSATFTMTINGTNFPANAQLYMQYGSQSVWLTPISASAMQMMVAIPASAIATAGTASIAVYAPCCGQSSSVPFTINPVSPNFTSLTPSSVTAGGAGFTLMIHGTAFTPDATVTWESTSLATIYISPTQLSVAVPASLIQSSGRIGISVHVDCCGWTGKLPLFINPALPVITSITPSSVTAGGAGFMLTMNGTAFTPDATVIWGTTSLGTVYISPTQLSVAVPASLIEFPGTSSVTVSMAAGTSASATITINPASPVITSITPSSVIAGSAGFMLTMSGTAFTPNATAAWGSTALTTTYISQTQLTAVVPANLIAGAGTASVSVTTSAGTSPSIPVTINSAIKITTTTLPAGTAASAYSGSINVTGGAPGYTWTVTGLPSSMSYSNTSDSTLTISGTPVSSGAITFHVSVQDTMGAAAGPVTYTINVAVGPSGANNANLNGSYVCLLQGSIDTDGTRWATLASFQADGQGNFSGGIIDTNSYDIGSASGTMSGSYNIGADNNGMASIHTVLTQGAAGIQTTQWAIALSSAAQPARQFRMIEADDLGTLPSNQQGTAQCYLATTSAFAASTINGNSFAFGLDGEDNKSNMKSAVGLFSASHGKITGGNIDMAQGGNTTVQTAAFTATYTAPDPVSGRFTMNLNGAGNSTGFTVYIIDANRMFILDNTNDDGEQAGNMRTQQRATYSGANIIGSHVLYMRGAEFNSRGSMPSGYYADVFQGTGDGAGNIAINQSYKNDAGVYSAGNSNGDPAALSFDSAHPGRATFQSASGTTYLYLFNNNSAFEMGVGSNGSLESGWLEPQVQTSFTSAALAGNYLSGNLSLFNIEPSSSVGVFNVTSSGVINAELNTASQGNLFWDQPASMTWSWDATAPGTGSFLIANSTQGGAGCVVISATKFVCASQTDPAPSIQVIEQ